MLQSLKHKVSDIAGGGDVSYVPISRSVSELRGGGNHQSLAPWVPVLLSHMNTVMECYDRQEHHQKRKEEDMMYIHNGILLRH